MQARTLRSDVWNCHQESLQRAYRASAPPAPPFSAGAPPPDAPLEVAPPAWGNWSQSSRDAGIGGKTWI